MTAIKPTAIASRPPWTLRLPAPLPFESGALVLSVEEADEVVDVDCWELVVLAEDSLDEELVAELLELSVEVMVEVSVVEVADKVSVLSVDVAEPVEVREPVEVAEPVTTPVAVPVAPAIPKLGEKLMLLGLLSSMISMVYTWELTSPAGGICTVAVPSEAGMPATSRWVWVSIASGKHNAGSVHLQARTTPESGVMGSCWSLMVTVLLEGFVHTRVRGWPAVTSNVPAPAGMLIALFCCADATAAHRAATKAYAKRILG
jgi:hypothetical protein